MMNLRKIIVMFLIIASILIYGCSNESQLSETTSASPAATSTSLVPTKDSQQTFGQNHNSWENEVNLGEIPELGYRNISTLDSDNYICYEDILVLDHDFYKKIEGKYEYQKKTVNSLFGIDKDLMVHCRQYKNKIVAVSADKKAFRVYDMDNESFYEFQCIDEDSFIGPFWSVYGGNILYSEWDSKYIKERTLRRINLISGDNREIYRPKGFGEFRIRDDGTIIYEIAKAEGCREFWQLRLDENGEWQEKKIWETQEWEFAYMLDFNQYGLVILGEFYNPINLSFYEKVVIKDNGEVEKLSENIQGEYLFLDNGYLLGNRAELEKMPWKEDDPRSLYLCDSVSFYDYEGNEKATYQLISKEKLENRYCLKKLIYSDGIITGFYVQEGIGTLYVSQVRMDEACF